MRVLIAEDDTTSRTMLTAVLRKSGYEVVETADGAAALEALQADAAPRLAVIDWMMPEMDGLEVIRWVRAAGVEPAPYIIMLTTRTEKADIVTALDSGADDYLVKPFNAGELLARIAVGRRLVETQAQLAARITELNNALRHIRELQGILPICSFCKKIRNDQGYWDQLESYMSVHAAVEFSHSVCPECMKKHYPEFSHLAADNDRGSSGDEGERNGDSG